MVTSRAETASSSTMTAGRGARARAIATRWRCPPESFSGNRPSTSGLQPHLGEQLAHPLAAGGTADVARHGVEQDAAHIPARIERAQRVLIDHRHEPAAGATLRLGKRSPRFAVQRDRALVELLEAERELRRGALAGAGLADDAEGLAGGELERDPVDRRRDRAAGPAEAAHQAGRREHRRGIDGRVVGGTGACPGLSRVPRVSAPGTAATSARVYSCCGADSSASAGPCSTTSPARMTRMWSASCATTERSWLISRIDAPRAFISSSCASTCACTVTSSAVVGSSAMTMSGSRAMAEAISARCRRPPDSWSGRWRARTAGSGTPTRSSRSSTRAPRAARSPAPWTRSDSSISAPTERSGSSETRASCSTKPISSPRTRRQSRAPKPRASAPWIVQLARPRRSSRARRDRRGRGR